MWGRLARLGVPLQVVSAAAAGESPEPPEAELQLPPGTTNGSGWWALYLFTHGQWLFALKNQTR